jgi:HlyD family secretion protein
VEEGSVVKAGDTLAVLYSATLPTTMREQEGAVLEARARLRDLERGARVEEVAQAEANVRAAESAAEHAEASLKRMARLAANGDVSAQQHDDAITADAQARERLQAAREALNLLKAGSRPDAIQSARAELAQAEAALATVRATAGELVLTAPTAGRVQDVYVELGELATAQRPIITISDLSRPWVRVYVGQTGLRDIALGQQVTARLDDDDRVFQGRVTTLNDHAEYTPRVALTEDERADLMFGVKVMLEDSTGTLKPGIPVTVELPRGRTS